MDRLETFASKRITDTLESFEKGSILVKGASENLKKILFSDIAKSVSGSVFVVLENDAEAKKLAEEMDGALYYPENPVMHEYIETRSPELTLRRVRVIKSLVCGENPVVVASVNALLEKGVFFEADDAKTLHTGDVLEIEELQALLERLGYSREAEVTGPGAYQIKGGIVDVFVMGEDNPVRIEFFDDEIDSIRIFDVQSGKSVSTAESTDLVPAATNLIAGKEREELLGKTLRKLEREAGKRNDRSADNLKRLQERISASGGDISRYIQLEGNVKALFELADNPLFIMNGYREIKTASEAFDETNTEDLKKLFEEGRITPSQRDNHFSFGYMEKALEKGKSVVFYDIAMPGNTLYQRELLDFFSQDNVNTSKEPAAFARRLDSDLSDGWKIYLTCRNENEKRALERFTEDYSVRKGFVLRDSDIERGFVLLKDRIGIYTYQDIFGRTPSRRKRSARGKGGAEAFFSEISKGDYVVHDQHGIGKYLGMINMDAGGVRNDYLEIAFAKGDKLYVNANQMDQVSRYVGSGDARPRLSRLGTRAWENMKSRTLDSVRKLADEYIEMYAARQQIKGHAFSPDTVWQKDFEDGFEYELTEDQKRCLDEIKADMEKPFPMDRLLCGDVGFGKTEVALRAAFKAVMDGKQVAVLVPTTILAMQHFATFSERMKDFPVNIEMLSRFKSHKEASLIEKRLAEGDVDIIIGTHRILSKNTRFFDLGLLIVDEEQRFGVVHKDKIKVLKHSVDTLTLSATPIPRTLNMSLVGIRDLSTIENPPADRRETETYVSEYDEFIIRDAVRRELDRGGQVFFVYNSVMKAMDMQRELEEMLPDVRIQCVNGRMAAEKIEDVMISFLNREFDVLVCTSIIESGLNVLNANTIIIKDSDRFGLSQLYQLRGRVGRSDKNAYCYITYDSNRILNQTARKRLKAIEEFTRFGSGFQIAIRDLQIRGAGNLLGANQSGHFANIGYELYTRMLREAFEGKKEAVRKTETVVAIKVDAYLPEEYMENEMERIKLYKKIAQVSDEEKKVELIDSMIDIYGEPPLEALRLIDVSLLRNRASSVQIERISRDDRFLYFDFSPENVPQTDLVNMLYDNYQGRFIRNDRFVRLGFPYRKQRNMDERLVARSLDIIEKIRAFVL